MPSAEYAVTFQTVKSASGHGLEVLADGVVTTIDNLVTDDMIRFI